jgi:ribose-phosphate pyrophosphokinase
MITYINDALGNNITTSVRQWLFPGGEVGIDINDMSAIDGLKATRVYVDARIRNSDDVMALVMTTNALRREFPLAKFMLELPYVPYARQDRVCNPGEALSIEAFADIINMLKYDMVQITDPHSQVTPAVIKNCFTIDQIDVFGDIKLSFNDVTIVAPDQGATKKCEEFAKRVGAAGVITCSKTRNLADGKIIGMTVDGPEDMSDLNLLVLDDICDGGRTFIELALLLETRNPKTLELAVTHGIFSKGVEVVANHYDHIYTTDSFRNDLVSAFKDTLTVIEIGGV